MELETVKEGMVPSLGKTKFMRKATKDMESMANVCHTPIPGPTRLANPDRFRGAKPYIRDSLPFFFFFRA